MSRQIRILVITIVILGLVTLGASCGSDPKPDSPRQKVTIGMVTFPGYGPLYVAKEKGFFGDVEVDLVRIEAIGDLRAALGSGNIDIYAATYDIFQANQGSDVPGTAFMLIDESHGADGIVASEGINSIADLKGKKLAGEPGLPPYFLLQYLLNKENLAMADISFRDIATQDAGAAFTSRSVDAAALYEPFLSNAMKARKGSKVVISSAEAPNILADLLFASDNLLQQRPQVLRQIAEGWFRALKYAEESPDDAYSIMAKNFNVSKEEMVDFKSAITWYSKEDNISLFDRNRPENVYTIFKTVGDVLERNGSAKLRFAPESKITDKIVLELKNENSK